jgi:hypothetical protein
MWQIPKYASLVIAILVGGYLILSDDGSLKSFAFAGLFAMAMGGLGSRLSWIWLEHHCRAKLKKELEEEKHAKQHLHRERD